MELLLKDLDFFYINLDQDREKSRRLEIKLDLMDVPASKIHRIKAHYNPDSHVGILYSQIDAIESGLKLGLPFVVLEDDVQINNFSETIKINELSQCTYLGLSNWGLDFETDSLARLGKIESESITNDEEIRRIKNMFSAHSILYHNDEYTTELVKNLHLAKEGKPLFVKGKEYSPKYYGSSVVPCDIVMAIMQHHYFITALKIPFFYQDGEHEYCTRFSLV
jgi:hypothetical protein